MDQEKPADPARIAASPPSPQEWARFVEGLNFAQEIYAGRAELKQGDGADHSFGSVQQAMLALLELLQAQDALVLAGLHLPYVRLAAALMDLERGSTPTLLAKRHVGHRRPMPFPEGYLMALSALAMEELMNAGSARGEAARKVARTIRIAKLDRRVSSKKDLCSVVEGWRDRLHEGEGGTPEHALSIWRDYHQGGLAAAYGSTPAERARRLLLTIEKGDGARWP